MSVRERVHAGLARLRRRSRPSSPAHFTPPAWHRIEDGPIRNIEVFVHRGHGRSMGDRIVAGNYEPELLRALADLAAGGGHLYDIGAHIGYMSAAWMQLGGSGVDAFEPVAENARIVAAVAARNSFSNVRVHQVALSDRDGVGRIRVHNGNLSASSMAYLEGPGGVTERIRSQEYALATPVDTIVRTLDQVVVEHGLPMPSAVKIDVEGAEAHVLRGASTLLAQARPTVICELHTFDGAVEVATHLATLGYHPQLLFHQKQTICNYLWTPSVERPATPPAAPRQLR